MYDPARKYQNVSPPQAGSGPGSVAVLATSATAIVVSVASIGTVTTPNINSAATMTSGPMGQYLTVFADTTDIGLSFGQTAVLAGTPALATVGTLTGTTYTPAAGTCYRIPAGQYGRYLLRPGLDLFVAIVSTGAGLVRMYQSSPNGS